MHPHVVNSNIKLRRFAISNLDITKLHETRNEVGGIQLHLLCLQSTRDSSFWRLTAQNICAIVRQDGTNSYGYLCCSMKRNGEEKKETSSMPTIEFGLMLQPFPLHFPGSELFEYNRRLIRTLSPGPYLLRAHLNGFVASRGQLVRQLLTAALNMAAGGATFPNFAACNAVCQDPGASVTQLSDCIDQTDTYNQSGDGVAAPVRPAGSCRPRALRGGVRNAVHGSDARIVRPALKGRPTGRARGHSWPVGR